MLNIPLIKEIKIAKESALYVQKKLQFPGTKITVEKGTPVYIGLYGLHTDPKYHPNPMTFDPERFSNKRNNEMLSCTYLPFGEGPRNCIGQ